MGIYLGCLDIGVAEEFLDIPEIDALFEEVGGEAMSEGVDAALMVDAEFRARVGVQ
jgi:hypothetical protein